MQDYMLDFYADNYDDTIHYDESDDWDSDCSLYDEIELLF